MFITQKKSLLILIVILFTLTLATQACNSAANPETSPEMTNPQPVGDDPAPPSASQPDEPIQDEPDEQVIDQPDEQEADDSPDQGSPPASGDGAPFAVYPGAELVHERPFGAVRLYFFATDDTNDDVLAFYSAQYPDFSTHWNDSRTILTISAPPIPGDLSQEEQQRMIEERRGTIHQIMVQFSDETYMQVISSAPHIPQDLIPEGKTIIEVWFIPK